MKTKAYGTNTAVDSEESYSIWGSPSNRIKWISTGKIGGKNFL